MPASIFGNPAAVVQLNQALFGIAPGNGKYTNQLDQANAVGAIPFARQLGQTVAATNEALAATVLANVGIVNATLQTALVQAFAAFPNDRGVVVLNLTNILTTLEGNAVYGAAAAQFNAQVATDFQYSTNPVNTQDSPVNAGTTTLTANTDVLTGNVFEAGLVFTPGGDDRINSLQDEDRLTGTGTNATLNATLGNANDNGGTDISPTLNNIATVNVAFTGANAGGANGAVNTLDLQDATGVTNIGVTRISSGLGVNAVNFSSINRGQGTNLTIANVSVPTSVNFDYQEDALDGAADTGTLNLRAVTLNAVSIHNAATVGGPNLTGFENLTLTSTQGVNTLSRLNATQLNALTITGDRALTLADLTTGAERVTLGAAAINNDGVGNYVLSSINASALTAGLTVDLTGHLDAQPRPNNSGEVVFLNAVGTAQADTFIFNQAVADSNITLDGGAATDILKVYASFTDNATTATRTSQINNVENLEVRSQAGANIAVDTQLIRDLNTILVRNENAAFAPVTFQLNNLTAAAADATGAIEVRHGTTNNSAITSTVVNAELKDGSGANDLVAIRIGTDLNTQNRFNFTINAFGEVAATDTQAQARAKAVENLTILDSDNESNTIRINEVNADTAAQDNNGMGTLTLTGGVAGQFLHLDAVRNAYGIAQDGSGAATFGRNTNPQNNNDLFLNAGTRADAGAQGGLNEGRLKFATINATAELSDVILRVGREATATESGAQNIMMGAGNDTVIFDVQADATSRLSAGLTRDDSVDGGAGNDILGIDGHGVAITVGSSEWTNVKNFETIRLLGNGGVVNPVTGTNYTLVLTNEVVDANQSAAGSGQIRIINDNDRNNEGATTAATPGNSDLNAVAQGSVTIDATQLSSTRGFIYDGEETSAASATPGSVAKTFTNDRFIVNDTINGRYVIDGGQENRSDNNSGRNGDILEVRTSASGSATEVTIDDLAGIRNVGTIDFVNTTTQRASVINTLNDTIVDLMVDSFQTNTTATPYVETLVVRAFANTNIANATTQLNVQAGQLTASKSVAILADRDTTVINTGAGADTVVLLGNFQAADYAGVIDAATSTGLVQTNIGNLNNATNIGVQRVLTAANTQINLGAGNDTVITYGGINFAGLPVVAGNFLGVENIQAFSNITLSESQFRALTTLSFSGAQNHTLTIVADNPDSAGAIDLSKITLNGGTTLTITNNSGDAITNAVLRPNGGTVNIAAGGAITVSVAQALANDFSNNNPVTVADTGAAIATALTNGSIQLNDNVQPNEIDQFDATDNTLTTTVAGINVARNERLTPTDTVVVLDTGANIAAAGATLGFANIDRFDANNDVLSISVASTAQITNAKLTAGDVVTQLDTGGAIAGQSAATLALLTNVDQFNANDNTLTVTVAQVQAITNAKLTAAAAEDTVVVMDSKAAIEALSAADIAALTNVDRFDVNANGVDNANPGLSVRVDQAAAIGNRFTDGDVIQIRDTGANLAANVGGLGSNVNALMVMNAGDTLDASDNLVNLTFAQLTAIAAVSGGNGPKFAADDVLSFAATTGADVVAALGGAHVVAGGVERVVYTAANQATTASFTNVGVNTGLDNMDTFTFTNNTVDRITGFTAGTDKINLAAFGLFGQSAATQFTVNGSTVGNGQYVVVRGAYDTNNGVFTANPGAGVDSLIAWDGDTGAGVTQVGIVLVGSVATAADLILV